jgi:hypothetical protein
VVASLLLATALVSSPLQQDQLIVEKKARYIPAGSGQTPFDVTRHIIRLDEIQSGGPPENGIPALDHPVFMSASEADHSLKARQRRQDFASPQSHPAALRAHYDLYRTLMFGRSELSRAQREMIAVVVSKTNGCHY